MAKMGKREREKFYRHVYRDADIEVVSIFELATGVSLPPDRGHWPSGMTEPFKLIEELCHKHPGSKLGFLAVEYLKARVVLQQERAQ